MKPLNRRQFAAIGAMTPLFASELQSAKPAQTAYLSFDSGIHVFSLSIDPWTHMQTVPSRRPVFLSLDRQQRRLFAVNNVDEHEGLPRGTVESYAVDSTTGQLSLIARTPLSLSATLPRHLAIAPDGRHLVAGAYGGGLYNVVALDGDKPLRSLVHIFKDTGCGVHAEYQASAHPHSLAFDRRSRLIASDSGSDRLSVFTLQNGKLVRCSRVSVKAGDGPGPIALHSSEGLLLVLNLLNSSLSVYRYSSSSGEIGLEVSRRQIPAFDASGVLENGSLVTSAAGDYLYSAASTGERSTITSWKIDSVSGSLEAVKSMSGPPASPHALTMMPGGKCIASLHRSKGALMLWQVDQPSGALRNPRRFAVDGDPLCLAIKCL